MSLLYYGAGSLAHIDSIQNCSWKLLLGPRLLLLDWAESNVLPCWRLWTPSLPGYTDTSGEQSGHWPTVDAWEREAGQGSSVSLAAAGWNPGTGRRSRVLQRQSSPPWESRLDRRSILLHVLDRRHCPFGCTLSRLHFIWLTHVGVGRCGGWRKGERTPEVDRDSWPQLMASVLMVLSGAAIPLRSAHLPLRSPSSTWVDELIIICETFA